MKYANLSFPSPSAILLPVALLVAVGCGSAKTSNSAGAQIPKAEAAGLRKELATSLAGHHEWAAAVRPLLALSLQNPNDPEIHTLLGTVYREQGLFEQGEASYGRAIVLDPNNAKAYGGRGILREVRGDASNAALEDFKTAIRLDPNEAAYSNNLGFALSVRGRYEEAAAALQEGLRHDPLSRRMRNNLGFVYGKLGQYGRAKREFEHGGTEDQVENNLGFVYEQAGDVPSACAHYQEALDKNPTLRSASDNAKRTCPQEIQARGRTP